MVAALGRVPKVRDARNAAHTAALPLRTLSGPLLVIFCFRSRSSLADPALSSGVFTRDRCGKSLVDKHLTEGASSRSGRPSLLPAGHFLSGTSRDDVATASWPQTP